MASGSERAVVICSDRIRLCLERFRDRERHRLLYCLSG
jgi:hypothetical protein